MSEWPKRLPWSAAPHGLEIVLFDLARELYEALEPFADGSTCAAMARYEREVVFAPRSSDTDSGVSK